MARKSCCTEGGCLNLGAETFHIDGSREANACGNRSPWGGEGCRLPFGHAGSHENSHTQWPRATEDA